MEQTDRDNNIICWNFYLIIKKRQQLDFRRKTRTILIATSVAARGIGRSTISRIPTHAPSHSGARLFSVGQSDVTTGAPQAREHFELKHCFLTNLRGIR